MANPAAVLTRRKDILDVLRHSVPVEERAVDLYRRLLAINELSCELNSARTLEELRRAMASFCLTHFSEEQVWICIADGMNYKKSLITMDDATAEEIVVPLQSGVAGNVIRSAAPIWIPDTRFSRKARKFSGMTADLATGSIMALPVTAIGKTVGCLEMTSQSPNRFNEIEYHLGLLAASHFSSALDNVLAKQELASANVRLRDHDLRLTQLNLKLQELAHTDEATGLFNKRRLFERLEMETARAKRYGEILSLLMIDLDDFKYINDTYGHQAGDDILRQTGDLLKCSLRVTDFIARYGGEEFTAVLPRTNSAGACCAAENLRSTFMLHPFQIGDNRVRVTISVGIASCTTFDYIDAREILRRADDALYTAKRNGKNQTAIAENPSQMIDESEICQSYEHSLTQQTNSR